MLLNPEVRAAILLALERGARARVVDWRDEMSGWAIEIRRPPENERTVYTGYATRSEARWALALLRHEATLT